MDPVHDGGSMDRVHILMDPIHRGGPWTGVHVLYFAGENRLRLLKLCMYNFLGALHVFHVIVQF